MLIAQINQNLVDQILTKEENSSDCMLKPACKNPSKLNFKAHLNHAKLKKVPITDDNAKCLEHTRHPTSDEETRKLES